MHELMESQPEVLQGINHMVPDIMLPKDAPTVTINFCVLHSHLHV